MSASLAARVSYRELSVPADEPTGVAQGVGSAFL